MHRELQVGADGVDVIVESEQEDEKAGYKNRGCDGPGKSKAQAGANPTQYQGEDNTQHEGEKNCDSTQAGQWNTMQMALQGGPENPSPGHGLVPDAASENNRKQDRGGEDSKIEYGQLILPGL